MVTRKNGRAPGRRWEREKGKEEKKKEGYEVVEGRRCFLTYESRRERRERGPAGPLYRCPRERSDVAGTRREDSRGDSGTRPADRDASSRSTTSAAMISLVVLRGATPSGNDDTGASRSGRQEGPASTGRSRRRGVARRGKTRAGMAGRRAGTPARSHRSPERRRRRSASRDASADRTYRSWAVGGAVTVPRTSLSPGHRRKNCGNH